LLTIAERIELLGGRLKIRSAQGKGSAFFLVVPDGAAAPDTVGVGLRAYPTSGGHGGPPLRVLLADDHQVVRQGLVSLLSEEDTIEVIGEAADGREAVELAERLEPDVTILDVSMPVMSGVDAARRIKSRWPHIRIVALSMSEDPQVRERMQEAGADSYLLKTAPYQELLAAIRGKERNP
jgi:CheY-like chemotaxis protein